MELSGSQQELVSESGRYRVVVTSIETRKGSWNYTLGRIYKAGVEEPIAEVRRNYSAFPVTFVEDHPNGHQYFIGGADYQGQTVIELDTGRRRDFVPEEAKEGFGFCWVEHRFVESHQMLIVEGCLWAAPFEFRFYDFSDPMELGWPDLLPAEGVSAEVRWPEVSSDGLIRTFELGTSDDDEEEEADEERREVASIKTYRKCGQELRFVSIWLSQAEQARRRRNAEARRAEEAWRQEFMATDPLYRTYKEQLALSGLSPADYESFGTTYAGWCPGFEGPETRWCREIHESPSCRIDLEWAVQKGPIKLLISKGKNQETKFFDHSAEGMAEAFMSARAAAAETA